MTDDREPFREAQQQARPPKWWYVPHYNFCCTGSIWCVLDTITMCRFKPICDRHDRAITGGWPTDAE